MIPTFNKFFIVEAAIEDAHKISALVNSVYRGETSKVGWTTEANLLGGQRTDPEEIQDLIRKNKILLLKSPTESDQILACVLLEKKDTYAYLGMLSVDAQNQGQNLGRQLIQFAEEWVLNNWNLNQFKITVIAQRPELISWYERRGFLKTEATEPFPMNDPRFGIPKRNDLYFVIMKKNF